MWDSTSRHCFSDCRHLTAHLYTFVRCLVEIWRYLSWPVPRDASKFSSAYSSSCFGHLGCRTFQQFSELRWTLMERQGQSRWIWQFDCSYLFFHTYVYIYICRSNMIKQSYSHSSFNYFYHATKPDRCIVAAQRPALHCRNCTVLRRMNLVWSTMKHPIHEIDSHGFAGGYCHSGLCSPVDLTSRSGQPAVQNLSYSKMVYCLSLRESMWVYLALPCLPSSFMYRIYPHCLGLKLELDPFQVGSVTGVKSHKAELVDALDFSCAQPNNGNGTDGTERQSHLFKPSFQAM